MQYWGGSQLAIVLVSSKTEYDRYPATLVLIMGTLFNMIFVVFVWFLQGYWVALSCSCIREGTEHPPPPTKSVRTKYETGQVCFRPSPDNHLEAPLLGASTAFGARSFVTHICCPKLLRSGLSGYFKLQDEHGTLAPEFECRCSTEIYFKLQI